MRLLYVLLEGTAVEAWPEAHDWYPPQGRATAATALPFE